MPIPKVRVAGRVIRGTQGNSRITDEPLFTTIQIPVSAGAVAAKEYIGFAATAGSPSATSPIFNATPFTFTDTNLQGTPGIIPNRSAFFAEMLGVALSYDSSAAPSANREAKAGDQNDLITLLRSADLFLDTQVEKQYLGPLWFWPQGGGPYVMGATTANATTLLVATNGLPALSAMKRLATVLILPGGLRFRMSIFVRASVAVNTALANIVATILLRGYWMVPA